MRLLSSFWCQVHCGSIIPSLCRRPHSVKTNWQKVPGEKREHFWWRRRWAVRTVWSEMLRDESSSSLDHLTSLLITFSSNTEPYFAIYTRSGETKRKADGRGSHWLGSEFSVVCSSLSPTFSDGPSFGIGSSPFTLGSSRMDYWVFCVTNNPVGPPRNFTKCSARQPVNLGAGQHGTTTTVLACLFSPNFSQVWMLTCPFLGESDSRHLQEVFCRFVHATLTSPYCSSSSQTTAHNLS